MTVSQRLDLRTAQSLVMTPQLQQAIKLLQMSNQDLCAFVAGELEGNPFLEATDTQILPPQEGGEDGLDLRPPPAQGGGSGSSDAPRSDTEAEAAEADNGEHDTYDSYSAGYEGGGAYDPAAPRRDWTETVAEAPSLRDHLLGQIHVDFPDAAERMVAVALVEMLDDAGYLPADLTLVRTQLGVAPDFFESVIARLHKLDPSGIFARSLKECLAIQLREKNRMDPAMAVLLDNLDLLAKRDNARLMRLCGVDQEDLSDMIGEIRALAPKPAMTFAGDVAPPVVPDVLLAPLAGGGWHIELNNDTLPRVLVNEPFYAKVTAGGVKPAGADKAYLSEKWQQANWLVKALHQRATTILKVASEIVKQQDKFFVYGVQHLKPLILRDIAAAIEMHESTVSRVTQNKFIATPRGMFELKYFFTNALPTTGGAESISTLAVRERIRAMIEAEAPTAILSDDRLAAMLQAEGVDIARRTVAKYRESLNIPTSAQRRRDKKN